MCYYIAVKIIGGENLSINERVKAVRNALNLTQKDFGQKLTLAQTYLSQIEKGDRDVTEKYKTDMLDVQCVRRMVTNRNRGNVS